MPDIEGTQLDPGEVAVAFSELRKEIDATGYGHWVSDDVLRKTAAAVIVAVESYKRGKEI